MPHHAITLLLTLGADTQTQTYTHAHTSQTRMYCRNQACSSHRPASAWFKNVFFDCLKIHFTLLTEIVRDHIIVSYKIHLEQVLYKWTMQMDKSERTWEYYKVF